MMRTIGMLFLRFGVWCLMRAQYKAERSWPFLIARGDALSRMGELLNVPRELDAPYRERLQQSIRYGGFKPGPGQHIPGAGTSYGAVFCTGRSNGCGCARCLAA